MLSNRVQWKNSIGDIAQRRGNYNLWRYYSTMGLGFHEYLQLCEDLGADPMYVVNCGTSCQYRGPADVAKGDKDAAINKLKNARESIMSPGAPSARYLKDQIDKLLGKLDPTLVPKAPAGMQGIPGMPGGMPGGGGMPGMY
jgi:hypothetical protein